MSIVKLHRYAVSAYPLDGATLALEAPGKPTLEVATLPTSRTESTASGDPGSCSSALSQPATS